MNTYSLNSLWSYLQSLALTSTNKKWLADHLYASAREQSAASKKKSLVISQEDLILSDDIQEPVKDITPLPADFDFDKEREGYIMQKYG